MKKLQQIRIVETLATLTSKKRKLQILEMKAKISPHNEVVYTTYTDKFHNIDKIE